MQRGSSDGCNEIQLTSEFVHPGKATVARMADLKQILAPRLLEYMETSLVRTLEKDRCNDSLTSALSLLIGLARNEDFTLGISLSSTTGRYISQTLLEPNSVGYLKALLGEYIFTGMMSSNYRKAEEQKGMLTSTSAAVVYFPSGSSDCSLQIIVGYDTGRRIWHDAF